MKTALITGVTGQDGSYLAEQLLIKDYRVYGLVRRTSAGSLGHAAPLVATGLNILGGDLADPVSLSRAVAESRPDEVYNLAAQSSVPDSWRQADYTAQVTGLGVQSLLEAVLREAPRARFFQASSFKQYGANFAGVIDESTPFAPDSPYAVAKTTAHHTVCAYRQKHGLFAVCGIMGNHESPRRGPEFVTQQIATHAARTKSGVGGRLALRDTGALCDWGFAAEYTQAMWLMLQQGEPRDLVIATGVTSSVADFARLAFASVGLDWTDHVLAIRHSNPQPFRAVVECAAAIGWRAATGVDELASMMVAAALGRLTTAGR